MHIDPSLPAFVIIILVMLVLAVFARAIKQPLIVGYIAAGFLLGPEVFAFVEDRALLNRLGEIGIILLLFLIGLEVSLDQLRSSWRTAVIGTGLQIAASLMVSAIMGYLFDWSLPRIVLIGFVLALSSTAVILRMLQDHKGIGSEPGKSVMAILIAQDIAIVPMMIILSFFAPADGAESHTMLQIIGGVLVLSALIFLERIGKFSLPLKAFVRRDPELQVLYSLGVCFGMATLTGLFSLSAALGAFIAGMIVHATRETHWVETSLNGFRVVFMGAFFLAIGMLLEINFLLGHALEIILLVIGSLFLNTLINAFVLRAHRLSWADAFKGGAMLAQLGEFGIVLATIGVTGQIITEEGYKLTLAVITITLALSPVWIELVTRNYQYVFSDATRGKLTAILRR
jgi:CPA2 family monovalent cation:H+ antiporter-2